MTTIWTLPRVMIPRFVVLAGATSDIDFEVVGPAVPDDRLKKWFSRG